MLKNNLSIYYNIYLGLKDKIEKGELKVSSKLPAERELMKIYNVSRTTIRQALLKLENEGFIHKIHGKGNFVSENIIKQELNNFYSFNDKMLSIGKKPSSKLIDYRIIKCNNFFSEVFKIPENSKIYHIKRLRLVDDMPAMLEHTFLPEYRFKNFDFEKLNKVPMYEIFEKEYDTFLEKAIETFKPIKVEDKDDIKYLEIPFDSIAMEIVRTTFEYDKVIEYTVSHAKNNMFEYTVVLNKVK